MKAIKIRSYKISPRGIRGFVVAIPAAWMRDMGLEAGALIGMYRDELGRLILSKDVAGSIELVPSMAMDTEAIQQGKTQIDMTALVEARR